MRKNTMSSKSKFEPIMKHTTSIRLCEESIEVLEAMTLRLACTKSQIVRYLILHYGKNLK